MSLPVMPTHRFRAIWATLALVAWSLGSHAADVYSLGLLQVPSLTIGNVTYSNLVLTVGSIVRGPTGSAPAQPLDSYDITTGELTIAAVTAGGATYYNVVVPVNNLVAVGGVSGADTLQGTHLSIPSVVVGGLDYKQVESTLARVRSVAGGMPALFQDQYDLTTGQLTIPAVQTADGRVYTNVVVYLSSVQSIGAGVPVPAIGQIFPDTGTAGGPGYLLTVNGSGFVPSSVLAWNGVALPTTYISADQLTAQVPQADLAQPGSAQVTVSNAAVGGPTSNTQGFLIYAAPVPQLLTLSPATVYSGGPAFSLTLMGTNFTPGSVVAWNGSARTTTYVSGSQLTAQVTAADIAAPGNPVITVSDPASSNVNSNGLSLTVTPATPVVSLTAFPTSVVAGKSVTLRWTSQYADSCAVSGVITGSVPTSGSRTLSVPSTLGAGTYPVHLVCTHLTASTPADVTVAVLAAPVSPPATAYRMNERHDGVLVTSNGIGVPLTTAPTWSVNFNAPVSYPLIANGMVYLVTANVNEAYGNQLYALDANTGATVWGPIAISGVYFGSGLTYDNGRLFVLMFDGGVHAFNASTGAALWETQLPGYWYEASPNAYGGLVFTIGNSGLSTLDEASGAILWTAGAGSTGWDSPAVSSAGVYADDCPVNVFNPLSGAVLLQPQGQQCSGTFAYTSILKAGIFFSRADQALTLINATTGVQVAQLTSAHAPAVTDTAVLTVNSSTLASTSLGSLVQTWTFAGDGQLTTAPVVVNNTVFVGSSSGKVFGVDLTTGSALWTGVAQGISADSESGGPMPPSGPAAGENLLVFPAGNSLVAWKFQ